MNFISITKRKPVDHHLSINRPNCIDKSQSGIQNGRIEICITIKADFYRLISVAGESIDSRAI
jgi:hypothetical protein